MVWPSPCVPVEATRGTARGHFSDSDQLDSFHVKERFASTDENIQLSPYLLGLLVGKVRRPQILPHAVDVSHQHVDHPQIVLAPDTCIDECLLMRKLFEMERPFVLENAMNRTENVTQHPGETERVLRDEEIEAVTGGTTGASMHALLVLAQWRKCLDQMLPTGGACGD
jgi:hypothetical protein